MNRETDIQELDDNSVYYCKSCHSLCVLVNEEFASDWWDGSYCGKCNSTDIGICSIDEWLEEDARIRAVQEEIEWRK